FRSICTTKVSPTLATTSPLASINMPKLSMATCPRGSVSTTKTSPAGTTTAHCTSSRSGIRRLSHPTETTPVNRPTWAETDRPGLRISPLPIQRTCDCFSTDTGHAIAANLGTNLKNGRACGEAGIDGLTYPHAVEEGSAEKGTLIA